MAFYDLHVHSTMSIGENSVEEMAEMGKRLGFSGIGIVICCMVLNGEPETKTAFGCVIEPFLSSINIAPIPEFSLGK